MSEVDKNHCKIVPASEIDPRVLARINKIKNTSSRIFFRKFFVSSLAQRNFKQIVQPSFPNLSDIYWTIRNHIQTGKEIKPDTKIYEELIGQRRFQQEQYQYRVWSKELINPSDIPFTFYYPCAYYPEEDKLVVLTTLSDDMRDYANF